MTWLLPFLLTLALAACAETTLAPALNHPANPGASPAQLPKTASALEAGFDPFQAYPADGPGAPAQDPGAPPPQGAHQHSHSHSPAADAEPDATVYTCPMHPEILRNAPGNCPICGMKLVPKTAPKHSHPSSP